MRKRAQMEMIGLVVIVILITLGMLFMAKFALEGEPTKKIFVRKGLAYSTMGALMKTSVTCENYDDYGFKGKEYLAMQADLIEDCAEFHGDESRSVFMCNNRHSCAFLDETIKDLLNKTLGKWNKHYEFNSRLLGQGDYSETIIGFVDEDGQGCPGIREASDWWISTDAGQVNTILYLCD